MKLPPSLRESSLSGNALLLSLVAIGLYWISRYNYLLFHSLVELFSVVIAFGIFILAWNSRHVLRENYLLFIGIAYLYVGGLDLVHTIAYKGMGVVDHGGANLATQLWIVARYTEALSLLIAPLFFTRKLNPAIEVGGFAIVCGLLLGAVSTGLFPACFIDGQGLTPFKVLSEYLIVAILFASLLILHRNRQQLDKKVYHLVAASFFFRIGAELAFTFYVSVYGLSNLTGHLFKFIGFYLIYKSLIETGLRKPYALLSRELKRNEAMLRQSEKEFRAMFELSAVGMAQVDPASKGLMRVNEQFCRITGYDAAELGRMTFSDLIHPEEREDDSLFQDLRLGRREGWSSERRFLHKGGAVIWVRETGNVLSNEANQVISAMVIVTDITERRAAEQALKESEWRFKGTFANAAVGIAHVSLEGQFLRVNDKLCEILGYSCLELLRKTFHALTHPQDLEADRTGSGQVARGEIDHYTLEKRYFHKDGHPVWVNFTGSAQRDDFGVCLYFIAVIEDISDRKRMEQALWESGEKFRLMAASVKDVIWMSAPGLTKIHFINRAYEEVWGQSCAGLYERPSSLLEAIHPDDRGRVLSDGMHRHAAGAWRWDYRIVRPDGSERWIDETGAPILDEEGGVRMIVGVARDITERKRIEEERRRINEQLEEKVGQRTRELAETVDQLRGLAMELTEVENQERRRIAEILHGDLQQLLAAGSMHAGCLLGRTEPLEQQNRHLAFVADVLNRAQRTARSLAHDLSPPILHHGGMNDILQWLAVRVRELYGLEVIFTPAPGLMIDSDSLRTIVYRVVQELLYNTVKHAGVNKAWLTLEAKEGGLGITVLDHGRGFDPTVMKRSGASQTAIGFGLFSITERIKVLGGAMEIDSAPGAGSRFTIFLPLITMDGSSNAIDRAARGSGN